MSDSYWDGFRDGFIAGLESESAGGGRYRPRSREDIAEEIALSQHHAPGPKRSRKKSAWQKYMAQKKNQIKFKSGPKKGRLNLKAMGRAYRRKKR